MSSSIKPSKNNAWIYQEKDQELYARSTVSSRSRTKANHRQSLQMENKQQLLQEYTRKRTCSYELNYMKPTIADIQRRNSITLSKKSGTQDPVLPQHSYSNRHPSVSNQPSVERRKSLIEHHNTRQPLVEPILVDRRNQSRHQSLLMESPQLERKQPIIIEPTVRHIERRQSLVVNTKSPFRTKTKVEPVSTTSLNLPNTSKTSFSIARKVKGLSHLGISVASKSYNAVIPQKSAYRNSMPVNNSTEKKPPSPSQGIQDTLSTWDREMMEALSPGVAKSPAIAIKFYGHHLSPFEKTEIHSYSRIFFVGHQADKIVHAKSDHVAFNYGYDDEHGNYKSVMHDHLAYRYEILEELGRGSFGQVLKCFDHKTTSIVAVKLIRNKKKFLAQAKYEIKLLDNLNQWDPEDKYHNLKMTDHFLFRNHLCIVTECLSLNLYEFIKMNRFRGFRIALIKRFAIQLLRSLFLLSKHGVIHCDLKPENILLKHSSASIIKVIDFGSSCMENQRVYTYIQSRFYRAPEIILGLDYTSSIDMWSLGCILAELYMGVPLFPGEDENEQMACIMEVLGAPTQKIVQKSERKHMFFDRQGEPKIIQNSRGIKHLVGTKTMKQVLSCDDDVFLDFIDQCLQWDPVKRLTPEKAFQHEWISSK